MAAGGHRGQLQGWIEEVADLVAGELAIGIGVVAAAAVDELPAGEDGLVAGEVVASHASDGAHRLDNAIGQLVDVHGTVAADQDEVPAILVGAGGHGRAGV